MSKTRGPVKFTNVTVSNGAEYGLWGRILDEVIVGRAESCVYDDETQEILPAILVLRKRKPAPATLDLTGLSRDVVEELARWTVEHPASRAVAEAARRVLEAEQPACTCPPCDVCGEPLLVGGVAPHWRQALGHAYEGSHDPNCPHHGQPAEQPACSCVWHKGHIRMGSTSCPVHGEQPAECSCGPCPYLYGPDTCPFKDKWHVGDRHVNHGCPVHGKDAT